MNESFGENLSQFTTALPENYFEKKTKRRALISVQCFYNVEIPEDMEFINEDEEAKWALKKFRETQIVDVVERLHGDNSFVEECSKTLDGRVKNFDMVQVDNITNGSEIDKLLEEISNGNK